MEVSKKKKGPKKPYCFLTALLALFISVRAEAQTVESDLVGLGMSPELAEYLAGIIPAGAALDNNVYLKGNNQAGSADINLIKVNATDDTVINSSASDDLILQLEDDANRLITFDASTDAALSMRFGDGGTTATQDLIISSNTSDADDDSTLTLTGAGGVSTARGSYINLYGNEVATNGGNIHAVLSTTGTAGVFRFQGAATFVTMDQTEGIITAAGKYINSTAYVPTMAAAPTPGVSQVLPGLNIVPTAAANTVAWLGASTPVPGQMFKIFNNSGAAVRIKGAGAATINGGTANKYIEMAIASYMECATLTTGIQVCPFYSVNGAVAAVPTPA